MSCYVGKIRTFVVILGASFNLESLRYYGFLLPSISDSRTAF